MPLDALLLKLFAVREGTAFQRGGFNYTYPCCISHASAQLVYPKSITYARGGLVSSQLSANYPTL